MYHYLEEELDRLRTRIIKMGSLVEEQIELAFKALFEENVELSKLVVERDTKVDKYDIKIDKHCQKIFALAQPVAIDLRLIMSALKINNELERMGDIAVNIAERTKSLTGYKNLFTDMRITVMAEHTQSMVKDSIDSFINNDPELARKVCKSDIVIDNMDAEIYNQLVDEMKKNPELITPYTHCMMLLKHIERLADHCTNIAEDVIFIVDAKIIKHSKRLGESENDNSD